MKGWKDKYREFRGLLVAARKAQGLTQVDLGARIGKPQNFISKVETGERRIDVVEFLMIGKALGVDPFSILRKLLV